MRILIDSTVWIDFFRGLETEGTGKLESCIQNGDDLCCCGFILTEILQGIQNDKEHATVKKHFDNLIYLEEDRSTFELAAAIYRKVRSAGFTIRNSMDCLIAATALQHQVYLLENDRDFRFIAQEYPLHRL